jgi:hypothetical protein
MMSGVLELDEAVAVAIQARLIERERSEAIYTNTMGRSFTFL